MGISHDKTLSPVKRDAKGLWIGSGNPFGRPQKPVPEFLQIARDAATEAMRMLVRCMNEADDWETKCRAANSIMDRAYGKCHENKSIDVSTNNGPLVVGAAPISQELWAEAIGIIEQQRSIELQHDTSAGDAESGSDNLATSSGTADIPD